MYESPHVHISDAQVAASRTDAASDELSAAEPDPAGPEAAAGEGDLAVADAAAGEADPAAAIDAALAEPANYDAASRAELFVTDAESLALALRRMRRNAGLSQRALAAKSGVAKTTIDRIETGDVDPTVATLLKLCGSTGTRLAIGALAPTTFIFGIVEEQRDRAGRHAPPHRLSSAGFGWWDTTAEPHIRRALVAHEGDLWALSAVATARGRRPGTALRR